AGSINNLTAAFVNLRERFQIGAKRRNNDDVFRSKILNICLPIFADEVFNSHGGDLLVDERVMNDLAENKQPAIGEHLHRSIAQIDCPLDSIAKAKLFGQKYGRITRLERATAGPN